MAPVGYNFNANKSTYRSKERGGKNRRIIIFTALTVILAGILYFATGGRSEEKSDDGAKKQYVSLAPKPEQFKTPPRLTVEKGPGFQTAAEQSFPKMEALFNKARVAYAQEKYADVRKYCYQIFDSREVPDENSLWKKTAELLGRANTKIIFSDFHFPEKKLNYHVKPNDGLRKIASLYNTSIEAVQRSNNMKLTNLNVRLGKTFNIYKGDWEIIISKSRRKLYLFDGKKIFKVYDAGIGKQNRTPTGVFKTGKKIKNPDWDSPKGKKLFGDKENVLGTRWISLVPNGKTSRQVSGLGIHGTWDPASIGQAESNGCLRLLNKDVEELFAIIPEEGKSIPVTIIK
ncbi:MAG: L,D-transpeptidase family protein [Victivallaceae bacterium]|nr:L,D-transpeptidase family protein [Victivallaceae bacterium]